jgi:hypothetical protein
VAPFYFYFSSIGLYLGSSDVGQASILILTSLGSGWSFLDLHEYREALGSLRAVPRAKFSKELGRPVDPPEPGADSKKQEFVSRSRWGP